MQFVFERGGWSKARMKARLVEIHREVGPDVMRNRMDVSALVHELGGRPNRNTQRKRLEAATRLGVTRLGFPL